MSNTKEKIECLKEWRKQHNLPLPKKPSQDVYAPEKRWEPNTRQVNSLKDKFQH